MYGSSGSLNVYNMSVTTFALAVSFTNRLFVHIVSDSEALFCSRFTCNTFQQYVIDLRNDV